MNIARIGAIFLLLSWYCSFLPANSTQIPEQRYIKSSTKKDLLKIEDLMANFELVCRKSKTRRDNMFEKAPIAFQIRDVLSRLRKDKSCYGQIGHIMASIWSTDRQWDYAFFVHSYDICEFDKSEWYAINDKSVDISQQESHNLL
jgi:hypothetical protein